MNGLVQEDAIISIVSFLAIGSTGWYDVNLSSLPDLPYLSFEYQGENISQDIYLKPPQKVIPSHYQCTPNQSIGCVWDYSGVGFCSRTVLNCGHDKDTETICGELGYYDPDDTGYISSHRLIKSYVFPASNFKRSCKNTNSTQVSDVETFGNSSFCHLNDLQTQGFCIETKCIQKSNYLELTSPSGNRAICKEAGEIVLLDSQNIKCSNPKHLCSQIEFNLKAKKKINLKMELKNFSPENNKNNSGIDESGPSLLWNPLSIYAIFITILLLISWAIFARKKLKNQ